MAVIPAPGQTYRPFFRSMPLATEWCLGSGIELGAGAHNAFGVNAINVAPFDELGPEASDFELYRKEQVRLSGAYSEIDVIAEAADMPFESESWDFVLSSHVLEHLPNLVAGLVEIDRVLKPGGIIFTIIPKRGALASDAMRQITPLEHFIADFEAGATVDQPGDDPDGLVIGRRGHYHVFTLQSFKDVVDWAVGANLLHWELVAEEETDSKVGNGHTIVYRKVASVPIEHESPQPESAPIEEEQPVRRGRPKKS